MLPRRDLSSFVAVRLLTQVQGTSLESVLRPAGGPRHGE
jgi:hypothetical protein